ncbi:MAG: peptidylprolyl isomerase [Phycisphaerales bacterium]
MITPTTLAALGLLATAALAPVDREPTASQPSPPRVASTDAPPTSRPAPAAASPSDGEAERAPALVAARLYSGLRQPIAVSVEPPPALGQVELQLMDYFGAPIGRAETIEGATVDLGAMMPGIWSLEKTAYLQLLVDGRPVGSALVVQPLRNRPLVRTTEAVRPDGKTAYTRIVGWGEELIEPETPDLMRLKESWKPGDPIVLSGVRVYPERDIVLETSKGAIRVALRADEAPNTAWNFRHLVEGGFFDGTVFHRVVPMDRQGRPFVIQGGDPTATGDGGPGWDLPIERSRLAHDFGVISMARSDPPDSAGSQFFFALSREGTARLDTQYCAFGEAVEGAQAILDIADVQIADPTTGRPVDPPRLERAVLVGSPPREVGKGRPDRRVERPLPKPKEDPAQSR